MVVTNMRCEPNTSLLSAVYVYNVALRPAALGKYGEILATAHHLIMSPCVFHTSWAWSGIVPAWAEFTFGTTQSLGALTILNGVNRGNHHITKFKVSAKREGSWVDLENVGVKDTPETVIGADGSISLIQGQDQLELMFDRIHQVSAVKLTVFETDVNNKNGVITELLVPCK